MRVFLTASVALVAVQQARAQDALTTTTLSPELGRGKVSSFIETESLSLSSLSSRIGPFYTSFVFAPGVNDYDYVSAIASGGPQDPSAETTTWKAYMAHQIETPSWTEKTPGATLWAYLNYTVGPTTYMDTLTYTYVPSFLWMSDGELRANFTQGNDLNREFWHDDPARRRSHDTLLIHYGGP